MPARNNAQSTHAFKHETAQFTLVYPTAGCGFKVKQAKCLHCDTFQKSWNMTTMLKPHLAGCKGYKKFMKEKIDLASAKTNNPPITDWFDAKESTAEELFALAVYTSTASFSLFDTPEWKAFHFKLGFKAPSRKALAGRLLTRCYEKIKAVVQTVADALAHIQIVTDGSSNIGKVRVENTSFLVDGISYYWSSVAIGAIKAGADWTVDNVIKSAKEIT